MIGTRQIAEGIEAAFIVARGAPGWEDRADYSADQVFRSLWAVVLSIPAKVLVLEISRQALMAQPVTNLTTLLLSVDHIIYHLGYIFAFFAIWAVDVWFLTNLAKRRGSGWKVSPLLIGTNWTKFLFYVGLALGSGGSMMLGFPDLANVAFIAVYAGVFYLRWGIVRRTLGTAPLGTMGVMALFVLSATLVELVLWALLAVAFVPVGA